MGYLARESLDVHLLLSRCSPALVIRPGADTETVNGVSCRQDLNSTYVPCG